MQPDEIKALAKLARLEISQNTLEKTANSITEILGLVNQLENIDTGAIEAMAHPLDAVQVLREDKVTENNCRDAYLALAPEAEDGLYLVPRVIE